MSNDSIIDKYHYFAFVVYPESAPSNWMQQLKDAHMPCAISPLHTPEDGKQHYHVIYKHSNACTIARVMRIIPAGIAANNFVEGVSHPRAYQRYLIHLDDPDKQQFADGISSITCINGFPLDLSRDYSVAELRAFRSRVFDWIRDYDVLEYSDLLEQLQDASEFELFDYAFNHTIAFSKVLDSRRNKRFRVGYPSD